MIDLKELCLVDGKAAWMAYLESTMITFFTIGDDSCRTFTVWMLMVPYLMLPCFLQWQPSHIMQIPIVSLNDDGRIVLVPENNDGGAKKHCEPVNKEKIKLKLNSLPFALTCVLHKDHILADPTSEEESIMETFLTVVLDSSFQLVSFNKPGGPGLAHTSTIQLSISSSPQQKDFKGSGRSPFVYTPSVCQKLALVSLSRDCVSLTRQRVEELQKILNEEMSDMEVD
ncbi:hypothetical protein OROGR_013851 [Orobanche gracilis]